MHAVFKASLMGLALAQACLAAPANAQYYNSGDAELSGSIANRLSQRMDALERKLAELNGRLEELDHRISRVSQQNDKLAADVEYRVGALERRLSQTPVAATAPAPAAAPEPAPQPAPPQPPPSGKLPEGVLGTMTIPRGGSAAPAAVTPPPAPPPAPAPQQAAAGAAYKLPAGSAPERYDYAVGLLRKGDYVEAERALAAFIAAYPSEGLTGNAQYWLAESYYVRGQYEKAATGFLEGYTKYPKSPKAPDSLLKLGMSLSQLGQKKEACATFDQLKTELPNASEAVKQLALAEAKRAGCR